MATVCYWGVSFLDGLDVFLVLRVVCSLSVGVFSYGLHICGGFWFVVFRLGVSLVVSTHSTGRLSVHEFSEGVGQGQRVLARWDFEMDCSWRFFTYIARAAGALVP